jgi:hypothetical protein
MPIGDAIGKLTSDAANAVHDTIYHLFANGVVSTGIVVGSILLAADQHLRVEEGAVFAGADLVDGAGVEIDEERARNMLAVAGLGEEGLERARVTDLAGFGVRAAIKTKPVLEKVAIQMALAVSFCPQRRYGL